MRNFYLICFLFLVFSSKSENRIFNRLSTESGLSSVRITSILQDKKGYIWFGTPEGLNRFDGFDFTTFYSDPENKNSIQKNTIEQLHIDLRGNIWIFFFSGDFSFYDPETEIFVNFGRKELIQQHRIYGKTTCFAAINENIIWIGTENGLLSYDYRSGTLERINNYSVLINNISVAKDNSIWISTLSGFTQYNSIKNIFIDHTVQTKDSCITTGATTVLKDRNGYVWVGTSKYGAFKSTEANPSQPIFQAIGKKETYVYQFMETWNGNIWIGHNQGASLIQSPNEEEPCIEHFFDQPTDLAPSGECLIKSIHEDRYGTVWFIDNRVNQGQFFYSPQTRKTGQIQHIPENPYSIASNQINCLYIDRFNNLWIGHDNYGISFCNLNKPLFNYRFGYLKQTTDLSSNHILSVYEDSNQDLWVATIKGLDKIDYHSGKIENRYTFSPFSSSSSLSGKIISSIAEDVDSKLWITYLDANPDQIDLKTLSISSFDIRRKNELALKCIVDKKENIWLVTKTLGLIEYNLKNQKTNYYSSSVSYAEQNEVIYGKLYSICADRENHIWIGNEGEGLKQFDMSEKSFINFRHTENDPVSLVSDYVKVLFCDHRGSVWIGTNAGLDKYNRSANDFQHFTVQDGLAGNIIQSIQEATPGILFIGTNKGLSRLNTQTGEIVNYSTDNKLLTNEFTAGLSCLRKSGELVFGTNNGILSFDPQILQSEQTDISLLISTVYINGKRIHENTIKTAYQDSKEIRIDFLSFNYADPLKNKYQYKLKGYDSEWRNTDSRYRYAQYSALPAGKYEFLVRVSEVGNSWSYPVPLSITILPAWWQSWWFILLCILVTILLLYILYKSRLHIYRVRQQALERKVEERTSLLLDAKQIVENKNKETEKLYNKLKILDEQKTNFFTNISHELRTPLTIIKGMTENLEQQGNKNPDTGELQKAVHTIQRNTQRLIRHVNELLDLATMDKGNFHPHITYTNLKKLLYEITEIFQPLAKKYAISFDSNISTEIGNAFFDREIIEQALFNILSNAFKYTPDNGTISLSAEIAEQTEQTIRIIVQDNGIGIPSEVLPHIFDRYYMNKQNSFQRFESSGIGLAHTKERIESHFGMIFCESEEGKGTKLTMLFPVSETSFPTEWVELKDAISQSTIFRTELRLSSITERENTTELISKDKYTLLFIEDNQDLLNYLANQFRHEYNVITAKNGLEGLDKALEAIPDAIISDIMMPVVDGLQLCERLKTEERTAHIPVLLLTARAEEQQQLEGYYAGADDYILKPFNIEIVNVKIKSLIKRTEKLQTIFKESFDLQKPEEHIPEVEKAFICKATQVVLENLQNPQFGVEEFCSEMAMSRANLFRKLKAATELSASTFTRNIRLKKAAELLAQKKYTVNEAASLVGFADANYFARCFKNFYGVTPSNYLP